MPHAHERATLVFWSYSYVEVTLKDFGGKDSFAIQGGERWFVNFTKIQRFSMSRVTSHGIEMSVMAVVDRIEASAPIVPTCRRRSSLLNVLRVSLGIELPTPMPNVKSDACCCSSPSLLRLPSV